MPALKANWAELPAVATYILDLALSDKLADHTAPLQVLTINHCLDAFKFLIKVDRTLWHSFVGGSQLLPFIQRLLLSNQQSIRATASAMLQLLAPFQMQQLEGTWLPEALSVAAIMDKLLIEACNCPSEDDRSQQAFQAINKLLPCFSQAQASLSNAPQHEDVSGESKLKVVCQGLLSAIYQHQTIEAYSEATEDYKLQCILGVLSTLLEQNVSLASVLGE